jgi:hypothetical protein
VLRLGYPRVDGKRHHLHTYGSKIYLRTINEELSPFLEELEDPLRSLDVCILFLSSLVNTWLMNQSTNTEAQSLQSLQSGSFSPPLFQRLEV